MEDGVSCVDFDVSDVSVFVECWEGQGRCEGLRAYGQFLGRGVWVRVFVSTSVALPL
jgi:hypothetical protein